MEILDLILLVIVVCGFVLFVWCMEPSKAEKEELREWLRKEREEEEARKIRREKIEKYFEKVVDTDALNVYNESIEKR